MCACVRVCVRVCVCACARACVCVCVCVCACAQEQLGARIQAEVGEKDELIEKLKLQTTSLEEQLAESVLINRYDLVHTHRGKERV